MESPITFYKRQRKTFKAKSGSLKQRLIQLSGLRLIVFILGCLGVYFYYDQWKIAVGIALMAIIVFLLLLSKYTDLKRTKSLNDVLVQINTDELKIASGEFHHRYDGREFQNPNHFYSLDIDLFGKGSFFQYLNRTVIKEGTNVLAEILTSNDINNIPIKQMAIQELASKPGWRQLFRATASLIEVETPASQIILWLKNYKPFLPEKIKWLPWLFTGISLLLFVLAITSYLNIAFLGYWLVVGLGTTGIYLKKINSLALHSEKVKDTFRQYALLLDQIENEKFEAELLLAQQQKIQFTKKKASVIFSEFSKALDALDNRNNLIAAIFGNGYLLYDIKNAFKVQQWIVNYADKVEDWFEVVSFFDAYNSFSNFAFNHPKYTYPKITNDTIAINAEQLGHPLLETSKRIDNNLKIENEQFFIVTGANMAGKSTFLRTVSLHIVMANVGLPVCAKSSHYTPVKLVTSMRTTDSLIDDSSYFFSELTRLKFIVDTIEKEPYFIVLDEILKGTNSTDKAEGSRKFVERLVSSQATGIIATHDLSLCNIEDTLEAVKNYYFDAEIINDELHFDYTFKKGVCQNMNASFLLKKMGIVG